MRKPQLTKAQTALRKQKNKIRRKTIFNMADGILSSCNVACGSGIMTLNPLKRAPYWHSTSGFDFDHITTVDMSFCTSLRNFI